MICSWRVQARGCHAGKRRRQRMGWLQ